MAQSPRTRGAARGAEARRQRLWRPGVAAAGVRALYRARGRGFLEAPPEREEQKRGAEERWRRALGHEGLREEQRPAGSACGGPASQQQE